MTRGELLALLERIDWEGSDRDLDRAIAELRAAGNPDAPVVPAFDPAPMVCRLCGKPITSTPAVGVAGVFGFAHPQCRRDEEQGSAP